MRRHGMVAVRYAEKNPEMLAAGTAGHLRPTDTYIDALLMIEAADQNQLSAALATLDRAEFAARGAHWDGAPRLFEVIYTVHVPPAPPK